MIHSKDPIESLFVSPECPCAPPFDLRYEGSLQLTYIHFKNATQPNLVIDTHIQQLLRTLPTALRPASQHQTALTTTPNPYSTLTNRKTRKKCTHLSRNTPNSDFTRKSKGGYPLSDCATTQPETAGKREKRQPGQSKSSPWHFPMTSLPAAFFVQCQKYT